MNINASEKGGSINIARAVMVSCLTLGNRVEGGS